MQMIIWILLLCLLFTVWLQKLIYRKLWLKNLFVDILLKQPIVTENDVIKLHIKVENRKKLPLPALSVYLKLPKALQEIDCMEKNPCDSWQKKENFSLLGNQAVIKTLKFYCQYRGIYQLSNIKVVNRSFFLDDVCEGDIVYKNQLIVYPDFVDMRQFINCFQALFGMIITNNFQNEDMFLIRGVREYEPFDCQKQINWKATAKLGKLIVNKYEYTTNRNVIIFLNLTSDTVLKNHNIEEESIRLVKTWCSNLEKEGIESNVYTNALKADNKKCIIVEKKYCKNKYMVEVNKALAQIDTDRLNIAPFFELYKNEISNVNKEDYYIIISAYQHEDFQKQLLQLLKYSKQFTWILPITGDSICRPFKELKKNVIFWDINWGREYIIK